MSARDILKVVVLVLIPINAWLAVLYYLHQQKKTVIYPSLVRHESTVQVQVAYFQQKWGIQEGQRLVYPFPVRNPTTLLGKAPSVGQGVPVLFLNISWVAGIEVWEPTIQEALNASPSLHIVLLFQTRIGAGQPSELKRLRALWQHFASPRISIIAGHWVGNVFGGMFGVLAFLCDGNGIVQEVEFYPELEISPYWDEEVADWRPKLHQAVKKVLDKFFQKRAQ